MFFNEDFLKIYEELSELNEAKADTQRLIDFAGEDLANRFLAIKNRLKSPENDLYYWIKNKTPEELEITVSAIEDTKSATKLKKEIADEGAELVGENEYWKVYHITTFEASQKYGRDTRWCITGIDGYGDKYWEEYTDEGIQFYFYITKGKYDPRGTDSKFALAVHPDNQIEIYDQQDCLADGIENAVDIPGIPSHQIRVVKDATFDGHFESGIVLSKVDNLYIKQGVTKLGRWDLQRCTQLQNIYIPASVTEIEDTSLAIKIGFYVDKDNEYFCNDDLGVLFNKDKTQLLRAPRTLAGHYKIPESVTKINSEAFSWCKNLTEITIPNGVTEIPRSTFCGAEVLQKVNMPNSIETIEEDAFRLCRSLASINLPEGLQSIGETAFIWTSLTEITIPSSCTYFEASAFAHNKELTKVNLPNTCSKISRLMFEDCPKLKTISLPSSVREIQWGAFKKCTSLASVYAGDYITKIVDHAFEACPVTIYCSKGTATQRVAMAQGIPIKFL